MLRVCIADSLGCYIEFVLMSNLPPPNGTHLTVGTEKVLVALHRFGESHILKVEHVLYEPLGSQCVSERFFAYLVFLCHTGHEQLMGRRGGERGGWGRRWSFSNSLSYVDKK